jgi:predicted SAM-dependent methyltransferase/ADP-heptose:LPS heptosyltransferase
MWRAEDPQGGEALKVKYDIVPYTRGKVLDLGAGGLRVYPHFTTVDNLKDTRLFGTPMKPDIVVDSCEDLSLFGDGSWDAVFSSHLLEHIVDTKAALKEWWRVVKPGGHLVLYLPHKELYPNVGQPGANADHQHDFLPEDIEAVMRGVGAWELRVSEARDEGREYSFLQVYRKRDDGRHVLSYKHRQEVKRACVCRFGGFGDHMMAANILPGLKREGFHVTYMTTPKGFDMLQWDPHIDEWLIQDKDQVPNGELGLYWEAWAKKFDRFVNLSESVEGTLLALPGRANHAWPTPVRQAHLGTVNYLGFHAELAQVELTQEARFYPTDQEEERAMARVHAMGGPDAFPILWVLAGSSVHKVYPHMDAVIAKVMLECPEAHVIMVGEETCKLLEQGWELEPRVHRLSGELSIRDTIALAQECEVVVGPETGVLNAVAFESMAKVCMLSHSSKENLTRDWVNTATIEPLHAPPCYPCHRLHYGNEFCPTEPNSGTAACAFSTEPADVWEAIERAYQDWKSVLEMRRAA